MDRGAKELRVTNFSLRIHPMLLQEIFQILFSNNNNKNKIKTYRLVACQKHTRYASNSRILKRMVPVANLSIKKEVSGTFPFWHLSSNRRLTMCTALSSSPPPPGHPGLPSATAGSCVNVVASCQSS